MDWLGLGHYLVVYFSFTTLRKHLLWMETISLLSDFPIPFSPSHLGGLIVSVVAEAMRLSQPKGLLPILQTYTVPIHIFSIRAWRCPLLCGLVFRGPALN